MFDNEYCKNCKGKYKTILLCTKCEYVLDEEQVKMKKIINEHLRMRFAMEERNIATDLVDYSMKVN